VIRRDAHQAGFTLIEVLVAMSLSLVIFGVTVSVFGSLLRQDSVAIEHNEAQEGARLAMDRMARQLRNLASPNALTNVKENRPRAVERATAFDLVARVVDDGPLPPGSQNSTNIMRARWCLDTSVAGNGRIWHQVQRWKTSLPPGVPGDTACPGSGAWDTTTLQTSNVVNVTGPSVIRPLFSYDSGNIEKVTRVHADVFVDPTPLRSPVEARVSSGVTLRNQNQYPAAAFTMTVIGTSGTSKIVRLDGSASSDAESQPLKYCWFVDPPSPAPACAPEDPAWVRPASYRDQGVVATVNLSGTHKVVLTVEDPAGLLDEESQTWTG